MNINLIQNIVVAILFAYFIILVFKSVFRALDFLITKIVSYLREKRLNNNVDQEYIDYLKEQDNVK